MAKAPVYRNKIHVKPEILTDLTSAVDQVCKLDIPDEFKTALREALVAVKDSMIPSIPIKRGYFDAGFGLDKAQKAIACDNIITLARTIKGLKAW